MNEENTLKMAEENKWAAFISYHQIASDARELVRVLSLFDKTAPSVIEAFKKYCWIMHMTERQFNMSLEAKVWWYVLSRSVINIRDKDRSKWYIKLEGNPWKTIADQSITGIIEMDRNNGYLTIIGIENHDLNVDVSYLQEISSYKRVYEEGIEIPTGFAIKFFARKDLDDILDKRVNDINFAALKWIYKQATKENEEGG